MVAKNIWSVLIGLSILTACQSIPVSNDLAVTDPHLPEDVEPGSSTQSLATSSAKNDQTAKDAGEVSQSSAESKSANELTDAKEGLPVPTPEQVVTRLQLDALQLQSEGRWQEAEVVLERAMRIDAEKVDLYHQMATVRMGQQRFAEAEQIALKGLTLTDKTPKYKASLWEVIGQCRSAMGDVDGARKARSEMLKWMDDE
ncbi:tetratricopeptide repeat protein [Reinekea sp. G2M2-21]|uniref:tetratricopeptide repeat protein n=1 Tax=Reinekea sp. G2M2-21 TaxID=2788942 RepID=UPI0018A9C2A2|nr:tetratricopeptide repeat protein [Reinekea sp. G2M2-21]